MPAGVFADGDEGNFVETSFIPVADLCELDVLRPWVVNDTYGQGDEPRSVPSHVIAALDETTPELPRGVAYVVAATVVVADEATARAELSRVLVKPGRIRPFHWHREGPHARERMMAALENLGAVAHVSAHYPTARRAQQRARNTALQELLPRVLADGADRLLIETRGQLGDERDKAVVLDVLRETGQHTELEYAWRPKSEPILWLADAVCGSVREHLLNTPAAHYFDRLQELGVIDEITYLSSSAT